MKTLWAKGVQKKIKEERLHQFIHRGVIGTKNDLESTFYHGINQLDAAHYLIMDSNGEVEISKYWDLSAIEVNKDISFNEAVSEYTRLFDESVKLRLRADVSVGSSLSGGLDSSSIVCTIDKFKSSEQVQKVFSARFKDFNKDEGEYIEKVVAACKGIEAHEVYPVESDIMDIMEKVAHHQEEPFGSSSIIAQWKVMELAKNNNVTVLLDGQGADEFLAGYIPEFKLYLNQLFFENRSKYTRELKSYNDVLGHSFPLQHYNKMETVRMRMGRIKRKALGQKVEYETLKERLSFMLCEYGLKELLRYADRNSMAHSES
jgi:asparagine synthase (glutamine-hydrolysing)